MATVINNPSDGNGNNSGGSGVVIGAVIVVLILIVVIVLSLPYIQQQINSMTHQAPPVINPTINVQIPTPSIPVIPGTGTTTK